MSVFFSCGPSRVAVFSIFLVVRLLVIPDEADAQIIGGDWEVLSVDRIDGHNDVICRIPTSDEVAPSQLDPHQSHLTLDLRQKDAEGVSSQFDISYDFSDRQKIRDGVEVAAARWSQLIRSPIPITIHVELEELAERTLAVSRMAPRFVITFRDGQNKEREFIFPPSLASYLSGEDLSTDEAHFTIAIHPEQDWYFGTGRPPSGRYDFISVMMHEIAHGLGIFGSLDVQEGRGIWPGGEDEIGLPPYIYDGFSADADGSLLTNTSVYPNPSAKLGAVLKGQRGGVFFSGAQTDRAVPEGPAKLYAPHEFNFGNSYSHLDIDEYPPGDVNALMKPRFAQREVIRSPGPLVCGMLADMGWGMGPDCFELLGGYILAFDGMSTDQGLSVQWTVESDAPIEEFVVESLYRDAPAPSREFEPIATVHADQADSHGSDRKHYSVQLADLRPGRHLLRLRARDADGTDVEVSPEQQITMPVTDDSYYVSGVYPNPVSEEARVDVTVKERQDVTMHLFDSSGRRVLIKRRALIPNIPSTFTWNAGNLSSGTYFVRLTGEDISFTEQVVVIR